MTTNGTKHGVLRLGLPLLVILIASACNEAGTSTDGGQPGNWLQITINGESVNLAEPYDAGTVTIGDSATTTFTVTNSSTVAVTLDGAGAGFSVDGTDASQFTLTVPASLSVLEPGTDVEIDLVFSPTGSTTGPRDAVLSVQAQEDTEAHTVSLTGTANGAIIRLTVQNDDTIVTSAPGDTIDWGTLDTNDGIVPKTFSIHNDGNISLTFTGIALSGTDAIDTATPEPGDSDNFHWQAIPSLDALDPGTTRDIVIQIRSDGIVKTAVGEVSIQSNSIGDGLEDFSAGLTATLVY